MQPRQQPHQQPHKQQHQQPHHQQRRHQSHHLQPVTPTAFPTHITHPDTAVMQQGPLQHHATLPPGSIILPAEHLCRHPQLHWAQHLLGQLPGQPPGQVPGQLPGGLPGQLPRQLQQQSASAAMHQSATQMLQLTAHPTQQQMSAGHSTMQMTEEMGSTGNHASPAAALLPTQCSVTAPRQTHQVIGSASTTEPSALCSSALTDQANGHCVKDQVHSIAGLVGASVAQRDRLSDCTFSAAATAQQGLMLTAQQMMHRTSLPSNKQRNPFPSRS